MLGFCFSTSKVGGISTVASAAEAKQRGGQRQQDSSSQMQRAPALYLKHGRRCSTVHSLRAGALWLQVSSLLLWLSGES